MSDSRGPPPPVPPRSQHTHAPASCSKRTSPQNARKRKRLQVLDEILSTERTYARQLLDLRTLYLVPIMSCTTKMEQRALFSNVDAIIAFHQTLLQSLEVSVPLVASSSAASASASASSASPGIVVENEGVVSARTYDYVGEAQCDANTQIFLDSIDTVAALPYKNAFAAIKLTALGNPQLLERLSQILVEIRELFEETFAPGQEHIDLAGFRAGLKATGIELSDEESKLLFEHFDEGMTGTIDIVDWTRKINFANMATRPFFTRSGFNFCPQGDSVPLLDETEARLMGNLSSRLDAIAEKAVAKNVQLMIDAEHTYFQPAINHFVLHLQCKHNVDRPLIFNTYQCYLTHSYRHLCNDLERAQRFGFYFAGKLVRGAYMVLERERAARKGYPDPIMPTLQATHDNYNRCVTEVLKHSDMARVMLASHNEHSIVSCVNQMNKENIDRQNGGVFFGQLLGMADHLTFTLARHGYQVFKYVPYGPVNEVIPYLVRRAQENADIMGGGELERELLRKELFARFFGRKK